MWDKEHAEYYWVVLCKNHHYHLKQSQAAGHPILLGESVSPPPHLETDYKVRCDDCGKEYSYGPRELLRHETEPPASFLAHPLFADLDLLPITQQTGSSAASFTRTASPAQSFTRIVRHLFQLLRRHHNI
jgi:hypothetical protein